MAAICLVGMPGVGKSRIGQSLAKHYGWKFIDTDKVMAASTSESVSDMLNRLGRDQFIERENAALLQLSPAVDQVISPGGSAIYCREGLSHVASFATIVYLADSVDRILKRVTNMDSRGIVWTFPGQRFDQLFKERDSLYRQIADIIYPLPQGFPFSTTSDDIAGDLAQWLSRRIAR
ncbi:shikimate kinase [bacterium]|nr:shikimate kinase [bacterium]